MNSNNLDSQVKPLRLTFYRGAKTKLNFVLNLKFGGLNGKNQQKCTGENTVTWKCKN